MSRKSIPKPSFLDECDYLGVRNDRKLWSNKKRNIFYTWDSLHGEIELFSKKGIHLGVLDPITGFRIKPAVKGRRINVS